MFKNIFSIKQKSLINVILLVFLILIDYTCPLKNKEILKLDEKMSGSVKSTISPGGSLLEKTLPFVKQAMSNEMKLSGKDPLNINSDHDVINMSYLDLMAILKRNNKNLK